MAEPIFRMVANSFAIGGGEMSSSNLCRMAQKLGYRVVFHPTRKSINPKYGLSEDVEIGPTIISGEPRGSSDVLVFYANDFVYKLEETREVWERLLDGANRRVAVLNFVMGCSWQPWFSERIDKFLFLNTEKEAQLINRLREKGIRIPPTSSLAPPVDLAPFLSLPEPDYEKVNFVRTGRYHGKFEKGDILEIIDSWRGLSPDSEYYFQATPPFLRELYGDDPKFHLHSWDEIPIPELLSKCSLFWYRLPKSMKDQGPRVIVEAMAAGLPVLAEPRDGAADRVTESTGWLESDNRGFVRVLQEITSNPGLLREKGRRARERAREEFDPWKWMVHILDRELPPGVTDNEICPPDNQETRKRQESLIKPKSQEVSIPKSLPFPFGNGLLREQEWRAMRNEIPGNPQDTRVLIISEPLASFLFWQEGFQVSCLLETGEHSDYLRRLGLPLQEFEYPDFPDATCDYDVILVSGRTRDGRFEAVKYAKDLTHMIFLRDSNRPEEKRSSTQLSEWEKKSLPMSLALFRKNQ